jgi:hypothetical protein
VDIASVTGGKKITKAMVIAMVIMRVMKRATVNIISNGDESGNSVSYRKNMVEIGRVC